MDGLAEGGQNGDRVNNDEATNCKKRNGCSIKCAIWSGSYGLERRKNRETEETGKCDDEENTPSPKMCNSGCNEMRDWDGMHESCIRQGKLLYIRRKIKGKN